MELFLITLTQFSTAQNSGTLARNVLYTPA